MQMKLGGQGALWHAVGCKGAAVTCLMGLAPIRICAHPLWPYLCMPCVALPFAALAPTPCGCPADY